MTRSAPRIDDSAARQVPAITALRVSHIAQPDSSAIGCMSNWVHFALSQQGESSAPTDVGGPLHPVARRVFDMVSVALKCEEVTLSTFVHSPNRFARFSVVHHQIAVILLYQFAVLTCGKHLFAMQQ